MSAVLQIVLGGVLAFAEAILGVGIVLPGEVMITGVAAAVPSDQRPALFLAVALGATLGDHLNYFLGRALGPRLQDSSLLRRIGTRHWDRAVMLGQRHGPWAVVMSRPLPVVRTLMAAVAGVSHLSYRRFAPASLAGSALWAAFWVGSGDLVDNAIRLARSHPAATAAWVGAAASVVAVMIGSRWLERRLAARLSQRRPSATPPGASICDQVDSRPRSHHLHLPSHRSVHPEGTKKDSRIKTNDRRPDDICDMPTQVTSPVVRRTRTFWARGPHCRRTGLRRVARHSEGTASTSTAFVPDVRSNGSANPPQAHWSAPLVRHRHHLVALASSRPQRLLAEVGRFLTVGGVATVVAFVLFNLLVHGFNTGNHALLGDQPIPAYVLANSVGMMISYRGTRNWAFRDRPPRQADGGRAAYVLINVVTMLLPIGCLLFSRDVLGLDDPLSDNVSANVVGLLLGVSARFYLFRRFVFRRPLAPHGYPLGAREAKLNESVSELTGRSGQSPVAPPVCSAAGRCRQRVC